MMLSVPEAFTRCRWSTGNNVDEVIHCIRKHARNGNHQQVIACAQSASDARLEHPAICWYCAVALFSCGEFVEAAAEFRRFELDAGSFTDREAASHVAACKCFLLAGDARRSLRFATRALDFFCKGTNVRAMQNLTNIRDVTQQVYDEYVDLPHIELQNIPATRWAESQLTMARLKTISPEWSDAESTVRLCCEMAMRAGDHQAARVYASCLRDRPAVSAESHFCIAHHAFLADDISEARIALNAALGQDPAHMEGVKLQVTIEALEVLRRCTPPDPQGVLRCLRRERPSWEAHVSLMQWNCTEELIRTSLSERRLDGIQELVQSLQDCLSREYDAELQSRLSSVRAAVAEIQAAVTRFEETKQWRGEAERKRKQVEATVTDVEDRAKRARKEKCIDIEEQRKLITQLKGGHLEQGIAGHTQTGTTRR
ncbi:hypothetical protein CALCODRAFT_504991 [Calocera cornea HHB12733]|uniref:TPR-like protein n=1 Tax=Calocera cornea HHB12733 TaxID=1353952 RepID=A0A165C309_9BASI|nr:hypothetical protein CALCODRAFT_504991 [Calocera cornea HHB12733]